MQASPENRRAGRSRLIPGLALAAAGLLVGLALYLFSTSPSAQIAAEQAAAGTAGAASEPTPSLRVDSLVIEQRDTRSVVDVSGVAQPVRRVVLGAETPGRVVEVMAFEHSHVAQGELLMQLDPALAEAAVERLHASVKRARASFTLALAEVGRQRDLARGGASSDAELERAESQQAVTAAQVGEAQALLKEAETTLAKLRITAPFAAYVSDLDLEPGAYLRTGDPVAELLDLSKIEIEVGLGDREIVAIADGDPVQVAIDVYAGEWFEGRVVRPGRAPDATTQKYPISVHVENPDERILPGMLGTVRFQIGSPKPAIHIPRRAVRREFELDYVHVLEPVAGQPERATAQRRRVATRNVPFRPDLRQVTKGLAEGEQIAISATGELRDGQVVLVRPSAETLGAR